MNHRAARAAAWGRTPITGMSGLVAPIRALADGNLRISWDLHQSSWTRALLEPAEAAVKVRMREIGNEGGCVKTSFRRRDKKSRWRGARGGAFAGSGAACGAQIGASVDNVALERLGWPVAS